MVWTEASAADSSVDPTAVFTSAQIASPWLMKPALESFGAVVFFFATVVVVLDEPPPPQPATTRATTNSARGARTRCRKRMRNTEASSGFGLLRPRDSNPDYLVQSEACCHYTRAQCGL